MRNKLHILICLLLFSRVLLAQTLIVEDFNANVMPPDGWTIDAHSANWTARPTANAGGSGPEARMFYSPQFNGASRFISPNINTGGYTSLTLSFRHFLDDYSGTGYSLGVATRGSNGPWHDAWTVAPGGDLGPVLQVIEIATNDVGSQNFQFCIYFSGNSYNMDNWYLDDIVLTVSVDKDVALADIDVPRFSLGQTLPVKGAVIDMGLDPVTSFEISYQIDDGNILSQSFSGFNLGLGDSWNFTFSDPLNLAPGDYMMKMWVSNANGGGPDMRPENDTSWLDIHVASQSVARRPMFEEFTSSTCGPCAQFNSSVFNPFIEEHGDEVTLVKYQMSWPSPGDPYYTEEGEARRQYYGVSYVPDLYTDGKQTSTTSGGVNTAFNNSLDNPAFMDVSAYHWMDGTTVNVHADINSHIGGAVVVYLVVFEKITTGNTGSNGETEFHHVMMKMIPDGSGTVVTLADGELTMVEGSADMSQTFVEELDDLGVAVFVQEATSKMVFQSAYSRESFVGIGDPKSQAGIGIYPNPSNGMIHFKKDIDNADIAVFSVYGQEITRISRFSGNVIDLTDLQSGNYILRLNSGNASQIRAISIVK